METLDNIFSSENEIVEKLKGFVYQPDYQKIFFEHLGPELKKIFDNKREKVYHRNFLEAARYEYGFFDTKIDLPKAFNLYKKYADLNDYFCMYKMHIIYLCEYEKFNVQFSRVLEKIYLIKCFAYLPNYIDDWDMKLFERIDVVYELAQILDLEDNENIEKHRLFLDLLLKENNKFNLSDNDINLMKGVLVCYFINESDIFTIPFSILNSLIPKSELDYSYYTAKNKSIFFKTYLKLKDSIPDTDIEKYYKDIESKQLYEFYCDYGNYLLSKKNRANSEIIEILKKAAINGHLFGSFRSYQCLLDFYDFEEIMKDYDKASILLDYLLDEIVFEKLMLSQFILLMGFIMKYSNFAEKIFSNYNCYVKEINDYITLSLDNKEIGTFVDVEFYYIIKAYIYYFGFKDIEEQNHIKAIEYLDKGNNITKKVYVKKNNEFIKFNIKELMFSRKEITNDELIKAKKDLVKLYNSNINLKYQTVDCYIMGDNYFNGITTKKDEFNALNIYHYGHNIFCKTIVDCLIRNKIKKLLNIHDHKLDNKFKEKICYICYMNETNKIFIPCKHNFCSNCVDMLEKDSKCPICRSQIMLIV